MAYHPFTWTKTDATSERWPSTGRNGAPDAAWYEAVTGTSGKIELYETKIGQHVAIKLSFPGTGHRIPLPEGYGLFSHCKPQGEGKVREDVYLFGSKHTMKFRSPNEFIPHVDWLLSSSNVDDHSTCGCQYNKGSAAHAKRKETAAPSSSTKRTGQTVAKEPKNKKKRTSRPGSNESEEEENGVSSVPLDRAIDLKTQRRFRRGELVWTRIDTVTPPPTAIARGAPAITHWPALVSKIAQKSKVIQLEPRGPTWTATNGESSTPVPAPITSRIVHYYEYHLRPLGFFSSADEVQTDQKEMLPWLIGSELMGGEAGWAALGEESVSLLEAAARKEAEVEKATPEVERQPMTAEKRWKKSKYAQRVLFKEMPKEWEFLCPRAALAIKMGLVITSSWTQTDMINVVDPSILSAEDRLAIEQQKKTIYQGLWWGGERLWLEDMVRINKLRSGLPLEQFPMDGRTPQDGCVFLKIRIIALSVQDTDATTQTATAWRCGIFGDLFELVPETDAQGLPQPMAQVVMKGEEPVVAIHKAPKGYKYRQLNDSDTEVMVDVVELAGRVYPDLVDFSTQSYFADPRATPEQNTGRTRPGQWVKGLMGLKNATDVFNYSDSWREDLYAIIKEANKTVEAETRDFYAKELRENGIIIAPSAIEEVGAAIRGPAPPPGSWQPATPVTAGNGNGNGNGNVGPIPMTLAEVGP